MITKREYDCLHLTLRGQSARAVGESLGISQRTVEEYLNNVKRKLGVHSKSELISAAMDMLMMSQKYLSVRSQ
jgi:LuxR family transcriptional activator of conjugal transfer of Ti plasmids